LPVSKQLVGYYLLLGMGFLIAAGIIDTLMKPSVHDLIIFCRAAQNHG